MLCDGSGLSACKNLCVLCFCPKQKPIDMLKATRNLVVIEIIYNREIEAPYLKPPFVGCKNCDKMDIPRRNKRLRTFFLSKHLRGKIKSEKETNVLCRTKITLYEVSLIWLFFFFIYIFSIIYRRLHVIC